MTQITNFNAKTFSKHPIGVMGVACRLPQAKNYSEFKKLLLNGQCAISEIPDNRFTKARYWHPKKGVKGKSYTFSAGVLENIWGFDPLPFGISPREATQMDPQQRLLLQVVWEAIEDTGIAHTRLAGQRIGVFVGASSTDHRDHNTFDPGSTDPYMMTGNTMSLIANRISYIFDLTGPSFTVDTACSSSLVAMQNAVSALQKGEIDTAIVGGVNALLSPFPFIGFSAAGMLSPEGLCRAFDANGEGYVRAEGALAVILQREDIAPDAIKMHRKRAEIIASGVNSDGKTVGVSLPSSKTQGALLKRLYQEADIDLDDIAFFEAHGTGTRVGDPAEATAIGENIAVKRSKPLPIGSVKSNIGHLEPAAGLAGLLKAIIAFEEKTLPASLHIEEANPDIPFEDFNIKLNFEKTTLPESDKLQYAGISTFGFGGTNAHIIIRDVERKKQLPSKNQTEIERKVFTFSAHGEKALRELSSRYATLLRENPDISINVLSQAINKQRAKLPDCLSAFANKNDDLAEILDSFSKSDDIKIFSENATLTTGKTYQENAHIAFVYNGNGAQFASMAQDEYNHNNIFKTHFDNISKKAETVFGWLPSAMLFDEDLEEKIQSTAIAQPLLFVIQMAITETLKELGLKPHISYGHSVGEIAAATCSGALGLEQGIKVIFARSQQQEKTRGKGKMAVGGLSEKDAEKVLAELRATGKIITLAANNAPNAVTVSGEKEAIESFALTIKKQGLPAKILDLDYGFHCPLMDPIESGLRKDLSELKPSQSTHGFISTVTGGVLKGTSLNADYWWRNIREPVAFKKATEEAFDMGCRIFIEIGPRSLFRSNLRDTLSDKAEKITVIDTLKAALKPSKEKNNEAGRHLELTTLSAIASGAEYILKEKDNDTDWPITLPSYPWQNKTFRLEATEETINNWQANGLYHVLLGHAEHHDGIYWRSQIDADVVPLLSDHRVDGKVIVPGAAYMEIALAASAQFFQTKALEIRDMDILRAIEIPENQLIEINTEISEDATSISISSRRRLSEDEWSLNATARIAKIPGSLLDENVPFKTKNEPAVLEKERLYQIAEEYGLSYGPTFTRATKVELTEDDALLLTMSKANEAEEVHKGAAPFLLHPTDLDIAFHGLIALYNTDEEPEIKRGFIPIRFGKLQLLAPETRASFAKVILNRYSPRTISADFLLLDEEGNLIAKLEDARFRAASLVQKQRLNDYSYHFKTRLSHLNQANETFLSAFKLPELSSDSFLKKSWPEGEARLLLEAAAQRIVYDGLKKLSNNNSFNLEELQERGLVLPENMTKLHTFLSIGEEAGFLVNQQETANWQLVHEVELPEAKNIIKTVLEEYPNWSAECIMLSHVAHSIENNGFKDLDEGSLFEAATFDQYRQASVESDTHNKLVAKRFGEILQNWPKELPFKVLEIGNSGGGLTRQIMRYFKNGYGMLISSGSDRRIKGILSLSTINYANIEMIDTSELEGLVAQKQTFDFILCANGLHFEENADDLMRLSTSLLSDNGHLIFSETLPGTLHDVLFSFEEKWFKRTATREFPLSAERLPDEWEHLLNANGFITTTNKAEDTGFPGFLIEAYKDQIEKTGSNVVSLRQTDQVQQTGENTNNNETYLLVYANEQIENIKLLEQELTGKCLSVAIDLSLTNLKSALSSLNLPSRFHVIDLTSWQVEEGEKLLSSHIKRLNNLLTSYENNLASLWVLAEGGLRALAHKGKSAPLPSALWTYLRTVRNEYPDIIVKSVDFSETLTERQKLSHLITSIKQESDQSEFILFEKGIIEPVAQIGLPAISNEASNHENIENNFMSRLAFEDLSGVDELSWEKLEKPSLEDNEVEVEIAATGLNFRDVMWTLGVLPDEALEDGFAGPTLGFECAGRISAVGKNVKNFKVGDPVIALGPSCFASHLIAKDVSVVKLPEEIDLVAAATIPVTFLTAYYALHDLARLEEGEWVLIQGGAGGVGLAAIQIAQWIGAKIIATAGTDEKRNFLKTLGVDHVLDSRSLDFVKQVREITGNGVDCILNSLFGEAMERGIELLKPFGRFLELGKRDYYGNTKIGLRPFRRNITYFGIDADQLLAQKPKRAQKLFSDLMQHFEEGTFTALPYRKFEGNDIVDAFRLMQKSGHIGKIVVTPVKPENLTLKPKLPTLNFKAEGHYIVIGGLGGFGLEIARWLSEKGARSIILTSRSGKASQEHQDLFKHYGKQGITIKAQACDVSDKEALSIFLEEARQEAPISGILHAAMVLRDGLINNMSEDDIDVVLSPKVNGIDLLDQLTQSDPIETFILFSSITTFIGNPGQANYVAANGYLEGIARRRRQNGKPALAVGWGAISDVGYLARNKDVGETISKRSGTMNFTANQALKVLETLILRDDGSLEHAVISVAPMNWSVAKGGLNLLKTPPFEVINRHADQASQGSSESLDLEALIEGKTVPEAQAIISSLLAKEVSGVLRTPVEEINLRRPLTDLGMDSLMGVELRMTAQQKMGVDIPLASIANGVTIEDISNKILQRMKDPSKKGDHVSELASYHLEESDYQQEIEAFEAEQDKKKNS